MDARRGTALLVLDVFNTFGFAGGDALARNAGRALPRIAALRERFRRHGAPVVFVNDNFSDWRHDLPKLVEICRATPGVGAAIAAKLAPRGDEYSVLKPKHSGFLATPLDVLLRQSGVSRLVLCGLAADACVLATAQDAKMRDYDVWVPGDAVAAMTADRKATALRLMRVSMELDVRTTRSVRGLFP